MMGAVQEDELTRIAALVTTPDGSSGSLRARPRNGVPNPGGDRLDEIARWWGKVVGNQLPQRVEHFWLPHTGSAGPVRSQVVLHRFTAPRDPEDALDWGVATADDAVDDGTDLILLSIPVPADEVAWQVAAAQVLGLDAVEASGWPVPGQTDPEWIARVARIRDGLKVVRGNRKDPFRLLHLLEHRELLAGTGLLLQAAARRTPVILDGPVAITCALLAARLAPASHTWWLAADSGRSVLMRRVLEELRLTAVTDLGLDEGDGTAARFTLQLLETAVLRAQERSDGEVVQAAPVDEAVGGATSGPVDSEAEDGVAGYADSVAGDAGSVAEDRGSVAGDSAAVTGDAGSLAGDPGSVAGDARSVAGGTAAVAEDAGSVAGGTAAVAGGAATGAVLAGVTADEAGADTVAADPAPDPEQALDPALDPDADAAALDGADSLASAPATEFNDSIFEAMAAATSAAPDLEPDLGPDPGPEPNLEPELDLGPSGEPDSERASEAEFQPAAEPTSELLPESDLESDVREQDLEPDAEPPAELTSKPVPQPDLEPDGESDVAPGPTDAPRR